MSNTSSVSEFLKSAFQLIDTEAKWTKHTFARDIHGFQVDITNSEACTFCSLGALIRVRHVDFPQDDTYEIYKQARHTLSRVMGMPVEVFNDGAGYDQLAKAWQDAIHLASAEKDAGAGAVLVHI